MRTTTILGFLISLLALTSVANAQQAPDEPSVADKYFAKYVKGEIKSLEPMMADKFHFYDSVSDFKGKEEAIKGLSEIFSNVKMGKFTEHNRFRSGTNTVYNGKLQFVFDGKAINQPGREFKFDVAFIVALTIDGDKIIRHVDYVDSDAFTAQLQKQLNQEKKTAN